MVVSVKVALVPIHAVCAAGWLLIVMGCTTVTATVVGADVQVAVDLVTEYDVVVNGLAYTVASTEPAV